MGRLNIQQNTNEWHELRSMKIGGSDAPIIMGVSTKKTPFQLWGEKVLFKKQKDNWAMKEGRMWEPIIRQQVSDEMKLQFKPEVWVSDDKPWMMVSLDGFCKGELIEIKRTNAEYHAMARAGKVPEEFMPQCQHAMECVQVSGMTYVSSYQDDLLYVPVDVDADYTHHLVNEEEEFYKLVMSFTMPPMTERDKVCKDADADFVAGWLRAKNYKEQADFFMDMYEKEKDRLVQQSDGRCVEGNLGKLTKFVEKGRVDYKNIPELKAVNLDHYRKEPIEKWKITFAENAQK